MKRRYAALKRRYTKHTSRWGDRH